MPMTNTWRRRLSAAARNGGRAVLVVLVISASINGLAILWRLVFPAEPPPIAATARTVVNQSNLVESFAIDCVTTMLTASTSRADEVQRCFPDSADRAALPVTPPLIVAAPTAASTVRGDSVGDITTYGVIVAVTEQPYVNGPTTRAYYRLPVTVYGNGAPRAMARPARVDPPPPGAAVELDYPVGLNTESAVATVVSGFITCYLTDAPGLERFITTDAAMWPLRAYHSATVTEVRAQRQPEDIPPDHSTLRVWVSVSARAPDYTQTELDYPLTLRASGGAWSVAAVDAVPAMNPDADPVPAPMPRN